MKLRRQSGIRASIFVASAGLFAAFFALVRANPHLGAAAETTESPAASDNRYERFFAGQSSPGQPPPIANGPHTRTRAS